MLGNIYLEIINSHYIKARMEAFYNFFNLTQRIYVFFEMRSKLFLFIILALSVSWQALIIGNIINDDTILYFLDPGYSLFLFIRIIFIVFFVLVLFVFFLFFISIFPYLLSSLIILASVGGILIGFGEYYMYGIVIVWSIINMVFHSFKENQRNIIYMSILIALIFSVYFGFKEIKILQSATAHIVLHSNTFENIDGELHFYNGKFYFIEVDGKIQIINDKFIHRIEYK